MGQLWKNYHVFFPQKWLLIGVYALPLFFLAGIQALGFRLFAALPEGRLAIMIPLFAGLAGTGCYLAEGLLNTYLFLGIGAREGVGLEYLMTSGRGFSMLQKALFADALRRGAGALVCMGGCLSLYAWNGKGFADVAVCCLTGAFLVFLFEEPGLLLARCTGNLVVNLLVYYVGSGILMPILMQYTQTGNIRVCGILFAADILSELIMERTLQKKGKERYYD